MKILTLLSPCLALMLFNCTAHVDGGSDSAATSPRTNQSFDKPGIVGPDVVGQWQSPCVEDLFTDGTRQVTMQFISKSEFKYTNSKYSDRACKIATKTETHAGVYQFELKLADRLFAIDYNYQSDKVNYKMEGQQLEFEYDKIYISELVFGNVSVNRDLPLTKVTPIANQPTSSATKCMNYAGTYQMNSDYFRIEQTDCSKIVWVWLATYDNPVDRPVTYLTDGVSHLVSNRAVIARFNDKGQFTIDLHNDQGDDFLNVYSFQKDPCELTNPTGNGYLTRDVLANGSPQPESCLYWANQKN